MIISREKTVFFIEPLTTVWADISTFSQVQIYILTERFAVPYYLVPVVMNPVCLCFARWTLVHSARQFDVYVQFFFVLDTCAFGAAVRCLCAILFRSTPHFLRLHLLIREVLRYYYP